MMFRNALSTEELSRRFPAIFAETTKESLSDKYLYIPTFKLIQGLEREGFKIVGAKQQGSRSSSSEHSKHVVYMAHGDADVVSKHLVAGTHNRINEEIPLLALTNSHNGLSSFRIDTAFFRLVCSNGLMMPTSSMSSARITHKVGMERDVIEASYSVLKAFPEQVRQIEAMKAVKLNVDERLLMAQAATNLAYDAEVIAVNQERNPIEQRLLQARRAADQQHDLWSTFNVIQENVIKGGFRVIRESETGRQSLARTRAVKSLDRDAKLNKELMTLAQKMLELKTGAVA